MSQPSSSIVSADNAETKYRKALREISKLISANQMLRQSNQKSTRDLKQKMDEYSLRYEDLVKQYETLRREKDSSDRYLDETQKQKNNLEREVAYLNDVVQDLTTEAKKLNMHKDERAVAALIRTYEEKQATMNRNRNQNEEMIGKLKSAVERLENDLQTERTSKDEYEERYKALSLEMNRYKEQNSALLEQIQRLIKQGSQKDSYCVEKEKELRSLLGEFQKQVSMLKAAQEESSKESKLSPDSNFEAVLTEKNKLSLELSKLQTAYEEVMMREKEFYEMEERMKSAKMQAERAGEEVNMLKSKIVVLEAKEFLEEAGDDDYGQKEFEERLNLLVSQNDPLNSIKNKEDHSHFRILKAFIVDLQDKIYKITVQKKELTKKYKSVKNKFVKNAQELIVYEEQNKVMKGKLEGYERLTEKLQFELEKSLSNHEQEITRMTITSNNIMTKKVQEFKSTINLLNTQLEMNLDKADRIEKNYKQEIETLKLQLDTLKIKYKDENDKAGKDNELIELYKKKNYELTARINSLEEQLLTTNENLSRFEHLFKEEKGKNEGLLSQKQQLMAQTRQLSEEIDKKSSNFNNDFKIREEQYEFEIRKLKSDNEKLRDELEFNTRSMSNIQRELEDKRRGGLEEVEEIKRQTQRNAELQAKAQELRKRIRELEDENETIKIRSKKFQETYDKTNRFEEESISKGDKINDLTREKITLESDLKNLQNQLADERRQTEDFKKEISGMKMKALEENHQSKREYEAKIFEGKKNAQSLNQDIADLTTELREEKSKNSRISNELNTVKSEKNRLQEIIEQNRKKEWQTESQIGTMKLDLSNAEMELERARSQIKNHQSISNNLNQQIQNFQQKIFTLNQEISSFKMKLESAEDLKSDLVKDLNSLKFSLNSVDSFSNQAKTNVNLPWQEQNFYTSVSDLVSKVKRIFRNYGVPVESTLGVGSFNYQSNQSSSYLTQGALTQPLPSLPKARIPADAEKEKPEFSTSYLDYLKPFSDSSARNVATTTNVVAFTTTITTGINGMEMTSATGANAPSASPFSPSEPIVSQTGTLGKPEFPDFGSTGSNYDISGRFGSFGRFGEGTGKAAFEYGQGGDLGQAGQGTGDYGYSGYIKDDYGFAFAGMDKPEGV